MTIIVVNYEDGIYLEMEKMNHVSVKRILIDQETGETAFGVVAYPGPGAGYNLATYSDEKEALENFSRVIDKMIESKVSLPGNYEVVALTSHVVPQPKPEPTKLELVKEDFESGEFPTTAETPQTDEPA